MAKKDNFPSVRQVAALVANAITTRAELMSSAFDKRRDLNKECGYPEFVQVDHYRQMYEREGIAARVNDVWSEECWQMPPQVYEQEDVDETPFETKLNKLVKKHALWSALERFDKCAGIGHFGVLLIGTDDGQALDRAIPEVTGIPLDYDGEEDDTPKTNVKPRKLTFLRTFPEYLVQIAAYEKNTSSPRYGKPVYYNLTMADPSVESDQNGWAPVEGKKVKVHWSRVIHFVDGELSSANFGTPRQQKVYNRLCDVRKLLGSSAEMFYRGAFPGFAFKVDPDIVGAEFDSDSMRKEFENYSNSLQRYLAMVGVDVEQLAPQVADPSQHFETLIKAICITNGVPWRVFVGSEQAQLASAQDKKTWNGRVARRCNTVLTPGIVQPVIERFIEMGILDKPKQLIIDWPDLNSPTDQDRADVAEKITRAFGEFVMGGVDAMIDPVQYLIEICGFGAEKAQRMLRAKGDGNVEEPLYTDYGIPEPSPMAGPNGKPANTGSKPNRSPAPLAGTRAQKRVRGAKKPDSQRVNKP